jgi:DNA-binding CsgD family transcriptional regulator
MKNLGHRDLRLLSCALLHVHATRGSHDFSFHLLQAMRTLIGADICVVDWTHSQRLGVQTAYDPVGAVSAEVNEAVHRHLDDNPLYRRRKVAPVSISDLMTRRQWHATALYSEAYGRLGQQDGLGLDIVFDDGSLMSLVTTRSRRGYGAADREKIALLGAHVRHVYGRLDRERRSAVSSPVALTLTVREREILMHAGSGLRNPEMAALLGISSGTVKRHLENAYRKLGVGNRRDAIERMRPSGTRHS